MDTVVINELIADLEKSESSLSNIRNLSALYTVRDKLSPKTETDTTRKELDDILPSYIEYVTSKRHSAMTLTSDEFVLINMQKLCKEIREFIHTLYTSTSSEAERKVIKKLIIDLKEAF